MSSADMKEIVTSWFVGPDTCFLVGAGCSKCGGKPLISDLTKLVLAKLDPATNSEFKELKEIDGRIPTIEDLINYLVRYQSIVSIVADPKKHKLEPDWIENAIKEIKRQIVTEIVDDWKPSPTHERLFTRIGRQRNPIDIFSLNYDTMIEATFDSLRMSYVDGFRGSNRAWFDPTIFEEANDGSTMFRLFKLHGSINWVRGKDGHVRRAIVRKPEDLTDDPVVIYPSEQKYVQTQYGVYEMMLLMFRARLRARRPNARLVTLGYSFNDEHINEAIIDSVRSPGSNLTVISFVGPEADLAKQESKIRKISERCEDRFNAYIGNSIAIGAALGTDDTNVLLKEELWKFEALVDFLVGVAP